MFKAKYVAGAILLGAAGAYLMSDPKVTSTKPPPPQKPPANPEPHDFGVPFAAPTGKRWPVLGGVRTFPYERADGKGLSGTSFGGPRSDPPGRKHAAIDVPAWPPQQILAVEDGVVSAIILNQYVPKKEGGWLEAIVVTGANNAILYGEVMRFPAALKVGDHVTAGQHIADAHLNNDSRSMLHMEIWDRDHAPRQFNKWIGKPPAGLLDPTKYLLALAQTDPLKSA